MGIGTVTCVRYHPYISERDYGLVLPLHIRCSSVEWSIDEIHSKASTIYNILSKRRYKDYG